jgi:hypothetical protein
MRFRANDLIHNRTTNEDGRVTGHFTENGVFFYVVAVPMDPTSWMLGSREARWPESLVEPSTNDLLRHAG